MTIQEKITTSQVRHKAIYDHLGMLKGTFNNKMKGNNNARFTVGEVEKIEAYLKSIFERING